MGSSTSHVHDESIELIEDEIKHLDDAIRKAPKETEHDVKDFRRKM